MDSVSFVTCWSHRSIRACTASGPPLKINPSHYPVNSNFQPSRPTAMKIMLVLEKLLPQDYVGILYCVILRSGTFVVVLSSPHD